MASLKRKYAKEKCFPISVEWVIKEERISKIREINDKYIASSKLDVSNLPGVKYYIRFDPKRCDKNPKGETYVYLNLEMINDMNISANIKMNIKSTNFSKTWTCVYTKTTAFGHKICDYEDLHKPEKKLFIDNQLIISAIATLTLQDIDPIETKVPKIDNTLGKLLWESETDKDVSIAVDGENEIKAHKCVLKRRSSKFAKMLDIKPEPGAFTETQAKVTVRNKSFDTVKEAVMFCYDIQSKEILSTEDAVNILSFSDEYEIEDLKENMEEFCIENLSVSNVCLFANSALTSKSEKLKRKCLQFLANCMKTGTAVKDIEKLNAEMKDTLFLLAFATVCEN